MTELDLEENEINGKIRYTSKSKDRMELPIQPRSERIRKDNNLKSKTASKDEDDSIDLK